MRTGWRALKVGFQAQVAVVGMNAFGPAVSAFLVEGPPPELQPRAVKKSAEGVGTGNPDHHRGRVGQRHESLFAGFGRAAATRELGFQFSEAEPQGAHLLISSFFERRL
jgi:hypothetical protein